MPDDREVKERSLAMARAILARTDFDALSARLLEWASRVLADHGEEGD